MEEGKRERCVTECVQTTLISVQLACCFYFLFHNHYQLCTNYPLNHIVSDSFVSLSLHSPLSKWSLSYLECVHIWVNLEIGLHCISFIVCLICFHVFQHKCYSSMAVAGSSLGFGIYSLPALICFSLISKRDVHVYYCDNINMRCYIFNSLFPSVCHSKFVSINIFSQCLVLFAQYLCMKFMQILPDYWNLHN